MLTDLSVLRRPNTRNNDLHESYERSAIGRSDILKISRYVSVQPRYNLLFREIERELLPLAHEEGLAVIPFNPLRARLCREPQGFRL